MSTSLSEVRQYLLRLGVERTAVHEAGHLLVAHHFGLVAEFKLWASDEERNWAKVNPVRGECRYAPRSRLTPFIEACIGWGGIAAEAVAGFRGTEIDPAEFRRMAESEDSHRLVSNLDLEHIQRHPDRSQSAQKAFEIVAAHREALELAIQKASREMVGLHSVAFVRPQDIGLAETK